MREQVMRGIWKNDCKDKQCAGESVTCMQRVSQQVPTTAEEGRGVTHGNDWDFRQSA